jgi:hypothetical protein
MQQAPRRTDVDTADSPPQAARNAPPIPIWAIFLVVAVAALALIYLMGLLAPTA